MDNAFWQAIIRNDYAIPDDADLDQMTEELMAYLGSPDPQLRDEIAYMILAQWIRREHYGEHQLRAMLQTCLRNITLGLGEQDTDSVFRRSFSALLLATITGREFKQPFLSPEETLMLLDALLIYLSAEQDLRGYVDGKGWVHAVAHTADALLYLSQSQHLGGQRLGAMMMAIARRVTAQVEHIFNHDEDERLAMVVMGILERNLLDNAFLSVWLDTFVEAVADAGWDMQHHAQIQNIKNFLRSLYFHLALTPDMPNSAREFRMALLTTIQRTHRYVRS